MPETICLVRSPIFTCRTSRRSAFGCAIADVTSPVASLTLWKSSMLISATPGGDAAGTGAAAAAGAAAGGEIDGGVEGGVGGTGSCMNLSLAIYTAGLDGSRYMYQQKKKTPVFFFLLMKELEIFLR